MRMQFDDASCRMNNPMLSNELRETSVRIVRNQECEGANGDFQDFLLTGNDQQVCRSVNGAYAGQITRQMICAEAQGRDFCQGDNGGPMTVRLDNRIHTLAGIVSWGFGCADVSIDL